MTRLDLVLINDKVVSSRSKAISLIKNGQVYVNDKQILKAGYEFKANDEYKISGEINPFVSRGGLKLKKAINEFNLVFSGKTILDIGSSTGGFTDCSLQYGAKKVYAVDVGHNQMHDSLRTDKRVVLFEDTDFRDINNNMLNDVDFAVCDVSFISLNKLLDKLCELSTLKLVFLIKPQFECGAEVAKKCKGVIKDKNVHRLVLNDVLKNYANSNYFCTNLTYSPIKGGDGNIEYIAMFEYGEGKEKFANILCKINEIVETAFDCF